MKKLTHEQSRRNAARRQHKVEARHRQAGHWGERSEPILTSQKINYEIGGNVEATPYGGLFAMHRLVTRLGLVRAIDAGVELLKMHLPYHQSDHVLTLAYSVLSGGTRLEDVDRLRNDVPLMNGLGARLLPDPTTVGDFLRRFTEADILALMDAINSVRPALWRGRGADLLGAVAYLDVDGTIVPTTGQLKQGMDISYKGIWGYAPLLVTLANTREVLYLVNRPGNAPSHLDAATWVDRAIALVAPYAKRVCVRGDTDFALTAHFDRWAEKVDFVLGTDNIAALRTRAGALPETAWKSLQRPASYENKTGTTRARRHNRKQQVVRERKFLNLRLNHEDVAEFTYQPRKCRRAYRIVVLRKNISRARGEDVLIDEVRYFFYFTTYSARTHPPARIVELANERCDQENIHGQLKSGLGALRAPVDDLHSNWAYMLIAALAWNIKSWHAMMMHRKHDRHGFIRMEFKRFLDTVVRVPAMVIVRARAIVVRLLSYTVNLDRFFSAWATTERTRFGYG
ncbi:IS1380 family transposase [Dactylosporangium sp. NPDC000555]|uniref:IS1380 family transposase n=1 Tax=Dactylosporangium sp. NPDC000555 TaxID=3154260 RepID=UPI003321A5FF